LLAIKPFVNLALKNNADEKMIPRSEHITVTNLPVYASKEFAKKAFDKTWLLVGDLALGVPYFNSLNSRILCGSQLAKTIHALLNNMYCSGYVQERIRSGLYFRERLNLPPARSKPLPPSTSCTIS
jgi:hypothetical protein